MLPQKKKHKRMDTRGFGPEKGTRGIGRRGRRGRRQMGGGGMMDEFEPELMDGLDGGDVFGFRGESEEAVLERVVDKNFFNDFPDDFNDDDLA